MKQLWKDIDAFDACSGQIFKLKAALIWTINDFLVYANLSRWSTKDELAYPYCNNGTRSQWLSNGRKFCYMGYHRWLSNIHKFWKDKISFNGKR